MSSSNPSASLLTIPCELRNAVYYYVFHPDDASANLPTGESDSPIPAHQLEQAPPPRPESNNLPFLLTCRQIHAECHALALHHTTFHLSDAHADPERFAALAARLGPPRVPHLRHLTLTARITRLRALNESWRGAPFGHAGLRLARLTLVPRKPECHASAYAEVADLSQSHTLAYILAETSKTLRGVGVLVVRNEGCFGEVVWRLVYRSLVYRVWRWAGPRAGLRFECSGPEVEEGREWLRVWFGEEGGGEGAREVGEEVVRLVGGKGEAGSVEDIPRL